MKSQRWGLSILLTVLLVWPGLVPAGDSPRVRLTFRNQTPQTVVVAIIHDGFDQAYDMKVGWYRVAPGASRTITLPQEITPAFTMEATGFHAMSEPGPGQRRLRWGGNFRKLAVRDRSFRAQQDEHFPDEWMAGFRRIELRRAHPDGDASATIDLKE